LAMPPHERKSDRAPEPTGPKPVRLREY